MNVVKKPLLGVPRGADECHEQTTAAWCAMRGKAAVQQLAGAQDLVCYTPSLANKNMDPWYKHTCWELTAEDLSRDGQAQRKLLHSTCCHRTRPSVGVHLVPAGRQEEKAESAGSGCQRVPHDKSL